MHARPRPFPSVSRNSRMGTSSRLNRCCDTMSAFPCTWTTSGVFTQLPKTEKSEITLAATGLIFRAPGCKNVNHSSPSRLQLPQRKRWQAVCHCNHFATLQLQIWPLSFLCSFQCLSQGRLPAGGNVTPKGHLHHTAMIRQQPCAHRLLLLCQAFHWRPHCHSSRFRRDIHQVPLHVHPFSWRHICQRSNATDIHRHRSCPGTAAAAAFHWWPNHARLVPRPFATLATALAIHILLFPGQRISHFLPTHRCPQRIPPCPLLPSNQLRPHSWPCCNRNGLMLPLFLFPWAAIHCKPKRADVSHCLQFCPPLALQHTPTPNTLMFPTVYTFGFFCFWTSTWQTVK